MQTCTATARMFGGAAAGAAAGIASNAPRAGGAGPGPGRLSSAGLGLGGPGGHYSDGLGQRETGFGLGSPVGLALFTTLFCTQNNN
jgi:hypothetical protein